MNIINSDSGYQMIVSGNIPRLTKNYIRSKVIDKDVWSDLYTTQAEQCLKIAIRKHLTGLGANVSQQLMNKLIINKALIDYCRKKYSCY